MKRKIPDILRSLRPLRNSVPTAELKPLKISGASATPEWKPSQYTEGGAHTLGGCHARSNVALQPPPRSQATREPQATLAAVGCKCFVGPQSDSNALGDFGIASPPRQLSLASSQHVWRKCPSVVLGCMDRLRLLDDVHANEDHPARAPVLGPVGDVT